MATTKKTTSGFSKAERDAMKARAEEMRNSGRGGKKKADEAHACLDAIAAMDPADRALGERIHAIVAEQAPDLDAKTWYGMPAYARDGKVICYFKAASKFGERYATFGFNDQAALDDGSMWPVVFALTKLSEADVKKLEKLVRASVG